MPPYFTFRSPPYEFTCTGWGYFLIDIQVILKPDYLWCEANGRVLPLDWILDFDGMGSSASHDYTVTVQDGKVCGEADDGKFVPEFQALAQDSVL